MRLHNAETDAGVGFDFLLQVFSKIFVPFGGDYSQGVYLESTDALSLLVHTEAQAASDGLAAFALGTHFTQCTNLKHIGVVPAFTQRRVRKDEL